MARAGSSIDLSAKGSSDPDGNDLNYLWAVYSEASSYKGKVNIEAANTEQTQLAIPQDAQGKSIHVILTIHDSGQPNLYAFRRLVVNVQ